MANGYYGLKDQLKRLKVNLPRTVEHYIGKLIYFIIIENTYVKCINVPIIVAAHHLTRGF